MESELASSQTDAPTGDTTSAPTGDTTSAPPSVPPSAPTDDTNSAPPSAPTSVPPISDRESASEGVSESKEEEDNDSLFYQLHELYPDYTKLKLRKLIVVCLNHFLDSPFIEFIQSFKQISPISLGVLNSLLPEMAPLVEITNLDISYLSKYENNIISYFLQILKSLIEPYEVPSSEITPETPEPKYYYSPDVKPPTKICDLVLKELQKYINPDEFSEFLKDYLAFTNPDAIPSNINGLKVPITINKVINRNIIKRCARDPKIYELFKQIFEDLLEDYNYIKIYVRQLLYTVFHKFLSNINEGTISKFHITLYIIKRFIAKSNEFIKFKHELIGTHLSFIDQYFYSCCSMKIYVLLFVLYFNIFVLIIDY